MYMYSEARETLYTLVHMGCTTGELALWMSCTPVLAITMDFSISQNFSNPKTPAKSRMNDKENDV